MTHPATALHEARTRHLRSARQQHHRTAPGRRVAGRACGADGGRARRLCHAHRRRGGVPEPRVGGGRGLRHRLRQCRHPHRPPRRRVRPAGPGPHRRRGAALRQLRRRPHEPGRRRARGPPPLRQRLVGRRAGLAPSCAAEKAREQLGTVGSGNHYVDIFADEDGAVWVGVHFGSRGLGHTIASGFLALSQDLPWGSTRRGEGGAAAAGRAPRPRLLAAHEPRRRVRLRRPGMGGAQGGGDAGRPELELVHNHHNFAWRETHDGEEFIVIRKGATPAFPGQKGFIGGSMGDDAVIVEGARDAARRRRRCSGLPCSPPYTGPAAS
jgi:hypothetical protein